MIKVEDAFSTHFARYRMMINILEEIRIYGYKYFYLVKLQEETYDTVGYMEAEKIVPSTDLTNFICEIS